MKMKKFLLVGLLGVVTLCGLSSCDDDDDGGYVPFSYAVGAGYCANGVSYCMIPLQTMRIKPSLVPSGKFYYTLGNKQGTTTATATAHSANVNRAIIKCAITETGILTGTISPQGDIDISADL